MTSPNRATEAQLAEAEVVQTALTRTKANLERETTKMLLKAATREKVLAQEISNQEEKAETVIQEDTRVKALAQGISNQERVEIQEVTKVKVLAQEISNQEKAEMVIQEVTRVKVLRPAISNHARAMLKISNPVPLEMAIVQRLKQEVTLKKTTLLQELKSRTESLMIKKVPRQEVQTAGLLEKEKKKVGKDVQPLDLEVINLLCVAENLLNQKQTTD